MKRPDSSPSVSSKSGVGDAAPGTRCEGVVTPVPEDTVAAHLHAYLNALRNESLRPQEAHDELQLIHEELKRCPCAQTYHLYREGRMPTLELFESACPAIAARLERFVEKEFGAEIEYEGAREEREELLKLASLFRGRADAIASAVQAYIKSVLEFHHFKRGRFTLLAARLGERGARARMEEVDHIRRDRHNALLNTLGMIPHLLEKLREYLEPEELQDIIPHAVAWDTFDESKYPSSFPAETLVFFGKSTLDNRDYIRDWAMAADFSRTLDRIRREASKGEQNIS